MHRKDKEKNSKIKTKFCMKFRFYKEINLKVVSLGVQRDSKKMLKPDFQKFVV